MSGHGVLVVLVLAVGYAAWAYSHPFRACPRCRASGKNRLSTRRRSGKCSRCKGTREVRTLGARVLHRAARSAVSYHRDRKDS